LADVLTGNCDPIRLLFPGGDQSAMETLYQEALGAGEMNALMRQAVDQAAQAVGPGRPLRVLEIGGGTAGVTRHLLPCLPADRTDYLFTDLSPVFVARASEKLAAFPFVRFAPFDVDRDVEGQPVETAGYDLIVAANVLHASRDLRASVRRVRQMLAPGGLLVLLEGVAPTRWLDLIFGLTGGWNHFTDRDLRPSYPLIPASQWNRLLAEEGFAETSVVAAEPAAFGMLSHQAVLLASRSREENRTSRERWLILADGGFVAEKLAVLVRGSGAACSLVSRGNGDATLPIPSEAFDRIVDCRPLDAAGLESGCEALLPLVQALLRGNRKLPALSVITRGAQAVNPGDGVAGFAQAPVWGLLRTIAVEHPDLTCRAIDLDADGPYAESSLLFDELACRSPEREVAFRGTLRWVSRIHAKSTETGLAAPRFRSDSAYLITGGLGGLGLCVAQWMVRRGAGSLALLGRRPPTGAALDAVRELRAAGARVECFEADVADAVSLQNALRRMAEAMPPLRGIVHAAGTLSDGLLENLTWDRFARVLAPKVDGAWNLHRQTESLDLDFFVMFSAAAAVFANPSQANHAAANAFLDSFASWRRAQGKPAVSIGWGAWSEIGAARGESAARRLAQKGMGAIAPSLGLAALSRLWHGKQAHVAVVPIDWPKFLSQAAPSTFYAAIHPERPMPEKPEPALTDLPDAADRSAIEGLVHREAARAIGLPSGEPLDDRTGFSDLGMDSLAAMEFRARLQKLLGCQLPSTLAFDYPTKMALVDHIMALLSTARAAAPTVQVRAAAVGDEFLDLSESEAEAQLVSRLNALNF
jgi:SAM-dependent methyltransferase/acyl carrier protein